MTATTTWSSPASGTICGSTIAPGVDDQGRILGIEFRHLFRCGWSQDLSLPVADRAMLHADNCYHLPTSASRATG
jgi:xanthine dehydrogenase molybdopterin-binding subunit B